MSLPVAKTYKNFYNNLSFPPLRPRPVVSDMPTAGPEISRNRQRDGPQGKSPVQPGTVQADRGGQQVDHFSNEAEKASDPAARDHRGKVTQSRPDGTADAGKDRGLSAQV